MRSMSFYDETHFIGVISKNIVVIDELDGPCGLDMVFLDAPMAAAAQMVVWATWSSCVQVLKQHLFLLITHDSE